MFSVLFIDDEANLLAGLRRGLHSLGDQFHFEYESDPERAVARAQAQNFDAVISDMRMPRLEGADVLAAIRQSSPGTVRIILSGQSNIQSFIKALPYTHRYLSKPCALDEIKELLHSLTRLKNLIPSAQARTRLTQLTQLPCSRTGYTKLTQILNAGDIKDSEVVDLLRQDNGIAALFLHLLLCSQQGKLSLPTDMAGLVAHVPKNILRAKIQIEKLLSPASAEFGDIDALHIKLICDPVIHTSVELCREHAPHLNAQVLWVVTLMSFSYQLLSDCFGVSLHSSSQLPQITSDSGELVTLTPTRIAAFVACMWGLPREFVDQVLNVDNPSRSGDTQLNTAGIVHLSHLLNSTQLPQHLIRDDTYLQSLNLSVPGLIQKVRSS